MTQEKKENPIITQSAAAVIAGVSRQALSGMCKNDNGQFRFFTDEGKVNTASPDWKAYLESRSNRTGQSYSHSGKPATGKGINSADNNSQATGKKKRGDEVGKQSSVGRATGWDREHSLTGGFDPAQFVPTNAAQLKALTDIQARNLEMRIKLGEYFHREILDHYMDSISQNMQLFVEVGRMVSGTICNKLDRRGMEKDVEGIINKEITKLIEQTKRVCNNAKTKH